MGLYTERLADEMGLYSGSLERIGMLSADSMRASRLVVDTGLHALGWSRQQAIDYFAANSPMSLAMIEAEIDRYVGMPGQACGYMIGRLEILRMRSEAMEAMGDDFDIKGFHDTVGSGLRLDPAVRAALATGGLVSASGGEGRVVGLRSRRVYRSPSITRTTLVAVLMM